MSCVSHLFCRIEAAEMKHNREWEEDWGAKDRPKSPKSPSPAPPEKKSSPSPKTKSSRKDTWKKLHPELRESFISLFFSNHRVVEVALSWVQPYFLCFTHALSLFLSLLCAVLLFMASLRRWSQLHRRGRRRGGRAGWRSESQLSLSQLRYRADRCIHRQVLDFLWQPFLHLLKYSLHHLVFKRSL